jgi:hypothetical protein
MSVPTVGNIASGMSLFSAFLRRGPACSALLLSSFGRLFGSLVVGEGGAGVFRVLE